MDKEVLLEGVDGFKSGFGMIIDTLLIVRVPSNNWPEPTTNVGKDLCIGVRHPADDGGIVLFSLAEERCLLVLGGDCHTMSVSCV